MKKFNQMVEAQMSKTNGGATALTLSLVGVGLAGVSSSLLGVHYGNKGKHD